LTDFTNFRLVRLVRGRSTDDGASFSKSATGAPVRVSGVADGKSAFDAVNVRQLKSIAAGVAGTAAMAQIQPADPSKNFSIGVGVGQFQSITSLAVGATYRVTPTTLLKASVATNNGGENNRTVVGVGANWSW
jgi:hypothetical protein